eukprot:1624433-Pyramimonas_sp.AAC.1
MSTPKHVILEHFTGQFSDLEILDANFQIGSGQPLGDYLEQIPQHFPEERKPGVSEGLPGVDRGGLKER